MNLLKLAITMVFGFFVSFKVFYWFWKGYVETIMETDAWPWEIQLETTNIHTEGKHSHGR